ncbi:Ger(x)C family spore germination protein [Mangrovibacillus sp. Mu-81]|uniref:Ger(x)C family spore germination protein n=1 Tax=Mangrovibacillus sp. Mu-81 TaxID=3121478 RepID=UPI002FE4F807
MNKKLLAAAALLFLQVSLTGCWDQRLLKNGRLVYSSSFDSTENGNILTTAIIRDFQGEFPTNVEIQGEGRTIRETRMKMDRKVSGNFEPSKNRVFLLGEDLARKDIYQFLDVFYRDPASSISSKIAIADGFGGDILSKLSQKNILISEYLLEQINSSEDSTEVDEHNLQTICTIMFDEGKDFILPLIGLENEEVVMKGNAIFHKHSMVGKLTVPQSTLYLILANKKSKRARFVTKIDSSNNLPLDDYVAYTITNPESKMKIISDSPQNIKVEIRLTAGISIGEFPADQLAEEKTLKKINKKIENDLTKKSEQLIETIQAANADLFGIGRELIAFHPKTWEKVKWEEDYPEITIIPKIETEIVGKGIID